MSQVYKLPSYQSIFDALGTVQVPLDDIVSVLRDSDLDLDSDLSGESISYETSQVITVKGGQVSTFTAPTTSTYTTNSSQNIFDVCLMTYGDLDKIVQLVSTNDIFNSINSAPDGVKSVFYNNSDITDSGLILAFKKASINITTGSVLFVELGSLLQEDGFYILQEDGFKLEL